MKSQNRVSSLLIIITLSLLTIYIPKYSYGDKTGKKKTPKSSFQSETILNNDIREPAVAGSFYPAEKAELERMIDGFLRDSGKELDKTLLSEHVLMVLVPHAGYVFSGRTAAYAFSLIKNREYDTVILLGCPHQVPVKGASVYCKGGFQTPLGVIPVNRTFARALVEASDLINDDERPHIPEHSIEVELPFLQKVLGEFSIVPVLVSGNRQMLDLISQSIVDTVRKTRGSTHKLLFLISTDLSHYPKQEDAVQSDAEILDAFCTLDAETLVLKNNEIMKRGIPNLVCTMCGLEASYVGIRIANSIGADKAYCIHRSTSADAGVPGASSERVVGYGAVAVTGQPEELSSRFEPLSEEEQELLLKITRQTLREYLQTETVPVVDIPKRYRDHLTERRGVFVSLYINNRLRGCIGNHSPIDPLYITVQHMTLQSALNDPRFPPLSLEELEEVRIELSVYLSYVEPISSIDEFEVGKHGITILKDGRSATFLPHVATEQGWDKKTTLQQLCKKAGLETNAWKSNDARFSVYETQIIAEK